MTVAFWESEDAIDQTDESNKQVITEVNEIEGFKVTRVERYEVVFNELPEQA